MSSFTFIFFFWGMVAGWFLAQILVLSKTMILPQEPAAYKSLNKKLRWLGGAVCFLFLLPIVLPHIVSLTTKKLEVPDIDMRFYLFGGAALTWGTFALSYLCPRCGKLLDIPRRYSRDALKRLTEGSCPGCGFSFDEALCSAPGELSSSSMIQNTWWIIPALLLVFGLHSCFYRPPIKVRIDDSTVTLTRGKEKTVMLAGPESEYVFLVNNGQSMGTNRGRFAIFYMDRVDALNKKYGGPQNWSQCGSLGSGEGMSSLVNIELIAADSKTSHQMEALYGVAEDYPQVKITASKLERLKLLGSQEAEKSSSLPGSPFEGASPQPGTRYLVKDIKILTTKYLG
ncbi:MAG: hypothetical protein KTQ49_05260 [Candidatus Omnitrophica bacterium]|nr:hypothetical protein [Candidatus Omnitrophota bacterium]